jgi:hypothetical protein
MDRWLSHSLVLVLTACASNTGTKGRPLSAFAPEGVTDFPAQRHALLVGVDHFEDARFNELRFAAADARSLAGALDQFDDVRALVRPDETRRAAILEALSELEMRIRNPRDTVLIYFSTHGSLAQRPGGELERQLVAGDTRLDLIRETGISVDELIHRAEKLPSRRVAVVLATCHAGRGKSRIPDSLAQALAARKAPPRTLEEVSEAVVVLSAAAFGDVAREDETLGHDVYTYFLIEALTAGDRDGDGAVTISEAHDYARERTWHFTKGEQRPVVESSILGLDPIVLRGNRQRAGLPVIFSYERSAEGVGVRVSGEAKGVLPGGFAVAPGDQRLELVDSGTGGMLYAGSIHLDSGERMELSRLIPPPPRLELRLQGGAFVPLSQDAQNSLPVAPAVGMQLHVTNWPAPRLAVLLGTTVFGGTGATAALEQPYDLLGVHAQAGLGYAFELGRGLALEPQFQLGYLWLSRRFHDFTTNEALRTLTLAPALEFEASPSDAFRIGVRLEVAFFSGQIEGPRTWHAAGQVGLLAGYAF